MARISAAKPIPAHLTWQSLHDKAAGCRACPLSERGTQTVFGEGPEGAGVPWLTAEFEVVRSRALVCLRARDGETRRAETARFTQDLRLIPEALQLHTRKAR